MKGARSHQAPARVTLLREVLLGVDSMASYDTIYGELVLSSA